MTEHYCFSTPLGEWTVYARDGALVRLVFEKTEGGEKTPLLTKAADQLAEYFAGRRKEFDLPLNPEGTDFSEKYGTPCKKFLSAKPAATNNWRKWPATAKPVGRQAAPTTKTRCRFSFPATASSAPTGVRSVTEAVSKSNNFCWSWKKNAADCPFLIAACRGFPA